MKHILMAILAVLLLVAVTDATIRWRPTTMAWSSTGNVIAEKDSVNGDTLKIIMLSPYGRVNVQTFFGRFQRSYEGSASCDSVMVLGRTLRTEADTAYAGVMQPILWLTNDDSYTVSEWLVFTPDQIYTSAVPTDSSFVPGAGIGIELWFITASTDTIVIPANAVGWSNKE